jgi:hypothetical protein
MEIFNLILEGWTVIFMWAEWILQHSFEWTMWRDYILPGIVVGVLPLFFVWEAIGE